MNHYDIEVDEEESGIRLDVYLAQKIDKTRSYINKLNEDECIKLNGSIPKVSKSVKVGDKIVIDIPDDVVTEILPKDIPISILFQDDDIVVINKQQGLTVHPGTGNTEDTLVNALLFSIDNLSGINGVIRPGIVHRLDKDTSGVMIVAKNDISHESLSKQIGSKSAKKIYRALVQGNMKEDSGIVKTKIGRSRLDRKKMAVTSDGKEAITKFKVLTRYDDFTYVEFQLLTGRTHQIRVHCKHLGHPIVGDKIYGFTKQRFKLEGQLLHSYELTIIHPKTSEVMKFTAPIPEYFAAVLKEINPTKIAKLRVPKA